MSETRENNAGRGRRGRGRKTNALDRCPGYEPNPTYMFLERCKHCGLPKGEHKVITSEGSALFSYLNPEDYEKKDQDAPKDLPLFSYLNVQSGIQKAREALTGQSSQQSFVPQGAAEKVDATNLKKVEKKSDGLEKTKEEKPAPSPAVKKKAEPVPAPTPAHVPAVVGVGEKKKPAERPKSRAKVKSLEVDDKTRSSRFTDLFTDLFAKKVEPTDLATQEDQTLAPKEDVESEEEEEEEEDDDVVEEQETEPVVVIPEPPQRQEVRKSSAQQPTERIQSRARKPMVSLRMLANVSLRKISMASSRTNVVQESTIKDAKKAHLDQIRLLMNVTNKDQFLTHLHLEQYEEPSWEALEFYKSDGAGQVLRWKNKMTTGWNKLHVACWNRDLKAVEREVKAVDIDAGTGDTDETALSIAVKRGALDCITYLLDHGADCNTVDQWGWSPLHFAIRSGNMEIVDLLLDKKSDCHLATKNIGMTSLHLAARHGTPEMVDMLLEKGLQVDVKDKRGWTPLYYCVPRHGQSKLVSKFIHLGSDIRMSDDQGVTPLHCAVLSNDEDILQALITNGARMDSLDINDWTPLHYAARYNAVKSLRTLLEFGARPNPKQADHISAYDIAVHFDYPKVMTALEQWPAFKKPSSVREELNCEDSCLGLYLRMDEELDLAELENIEAIMAYNINAPSQSSCCCIVS